MTDEAFTILVDIPLKKGKAEEFLALARDVFAAMKVEKTFVHATALRSADDPDLIMLYEIWLDRENFTTVELCRPYRDLYEARLPELLRSPRKVTFFDAVISVP